MDDRRPDRSSPGDVDNICTQLNFSAQYVLDRLDQAKDKFQTAMFYSMQPPAKQKKRIDDVVSWDSNPRSPHSTNTYELSFGMLTTTLPDDCL